MSRGKALTTDELDYINEHLKDMSIRDIAKALNRNYYTIFNLSKKAGIDRSHFFTQKEDDFIKENYCSHPISFIAHKLMVSEMSIYNRARKLGIVKNQKRSETA